MSLSTVVQTMRGPFLILTPACVFLGAATVVAVGQRLDPAGLTMVLLGALLAHVSVNMFNEYFDLKSGLDLHTLRTPFSGGSGALRAHPEMAAAVLATAWLCLLLTALIGLYFIHLRGWGLAPLGCAGLLLILLYTPWLNRSALACLLAPGLGFGPLMIGGTHYALTGSYAISAWLAGAVALFLASNLLLLNQLPDIQADRDAGRRHLSIRYGTKAASATYAVFASGVPAVILGAVALGYFPSLSLIALTTLPLAIYSWQGARRLGDRIGAQPAYLAANVVNAVLTPILLGAALILG